MQKLIFDEPYKFIPPRRGTLFTALFKRYLRRYLRKSYGIVSDVCRGVEYLKASLAAGHGVILAPNHCRMSDPMTIGLLSIEAKTQLHSMASWHVFKQDWLTSFVVRQLGAFSVYREGVDRASLMCAIEILERAERPLVIFPEGGISRTNDRLGDLMDGVAFVARNAAKRRARQTPAGRVVVHPVAIKYELLEDAEAILSPTLDMIEARLSWEPRRDIPLTARIARVAPALLCLKEVEHFGTPQGGSIYLRINRLAEHLLAAKEIEWLGSAQSGCIVARVKRLRSAILPDMAAGNVTDEERRRRWGQLKDLYLAQQLSCYPKGYVRPDSPPEHLLETVEGLEEDLTDTVSPHGPLRARLEVGEAIEVNPSRPRGQAADPLITQLKHEMQSLINGLGRDIAAARAA